MSDAEKDPHVLVSARAAEHPKLIELPSDRARWGWIVLLGKAKLQRPAGRFASRRVLDAVMGEHRRHVADYLRVGILELADDGSVTVHDWSKVQSRTTQWRRSVGLASGHESLSGKHSGNQAGNAGETLGETSGNNPPAGAAAMQSQSIERSTTKATQDDGGGAGGVLPDAADDWWRVTGSYPGDRVRRWIDDLASRHGHRAVGEAIAACHVADPDASTLMGRVRDRLARDSRAADRAEAAAEAARNAAKRAPAAPYRRAPDTTTPEEAERLAVAYLAAHPGRGSSRAVQ